MCEICFCEYATVPGTSVLLKKRCIAILALPHVAAWHCYFSIEMDRDQSSELFRLIYGGAITHSVQPGLRGIWIISNPLEQPDIIVYYCHGGGFSMGSSFFYMEFLLAWVSLLKEAGYRNPALFALDYSLVPDAVFPTQLQETLAGYQYVLSIAQNPSRICVGGDSAGATLILSFLL
jgi:acetyl esterase/lipase